MSEYKPSRRALDEIEQNAMVPTLEVTLDPMEAEELGAFEEFAITHDDAIKAAPNIVESELYAKSKYRV
ncbi:MAG: hypothetical protein EOP04_03510 [Proteobacteria bacterium]|nr:MAG: hypothetical protein EOP04_03510 [Pseudomonadota bacterium]